MLFIPERTLNTSRISGMRKLIFPFLFSLLSFCSFGQELNRYFAQGKFNSKDTELIDSVEQAIKSKAGIYMVRIDQSNGNVLIFTTDLPFLTEEEFKSFFGTYSHLITCPFIGIVRQDAFRAFPFEDCE